jgi:hypothetical protein
MVYVTRKQSTVEIWPALLISERRLLKQRLEKLSWVRVPVEVVFVARKQNGRRTAPRPNSFVSARILQEQGSLFRKTVLRLSPEEDIFCKLKTKKDKRTALRPKHFFRREDFRNKGHSPENLVLGSSRSEDNFFSSQEKHDRRAGPRRKLFVRRRDYRKKKKKTATSKQCPGF